ncbi:MAG: AAA family ATPase, partial [Dehalococcoidia bacterium]
MPGRSTHTPLVGRQRELRFLLERLDAAGRGAGGVVLVGGEPGIGKTRLVTELTRRARADGWQVLIGHAFDAEGMPPYVPFVEPLRGHVNGESAEALRQQLSRNAAAVALLLPEIRDRLPDLPVAQTADPEHARYHLFESMTAFVQSIARQQRLLFVLEDLHWADKPTVLLLQHLVRGIADAPLLVVATFRTTDLERTHPLVDVLADLRRERRAERLTLGALSLEDVAALIEGLAGALPAAAVTAAVERGTDGNPFFVEEVVQHLRGEGRDLTDTSTAVAEWGIPEGVREVIGRRLARLDADANALLRAGAILGAGFALDLLAAMGEIQPDSRLVAALEQAEGAGLLREDDGGYRFTHALIRETILAGLSLPRRQHLHLRAAEAIEGVHAARLGPHAGALALHFQAAGAAAASDKRLEYTRAAAEHAIEVFAWEEATAHLQAALDLTDPTDAAARCDLLLALGHTLNNTGEPSRTVDEVAPDALHAAESVGDADRASQVCQMALDALFLIGSF